jgi:hypothetical protein
MDASNLPGTYGLVTATCTYEGENTVLLLQTARYLVKAWKQAVSGQPLPPTVAYLNVLSRGVKQRPWKNTLTCIVQAHQAVAARYINIPLNIPFFCVVGIIKILIQNRIEIDSQTFKHTQELPFMILIL